MAFVTDRTGTSQLNLVVSNVFDQGRDVDKCAQEFLFCLKLYKVVTLGAFVTQQGLECALISDEDRVIKNDKIERLTQFKVRPIIDRQLLVREIQAPEGQSFLGPPTGFCFANCVSDLVVDNEFRHVEF